MKDSIPIFSPVDQTRTLRDSAPAAKPGESPAAGPTADASLRPSGCRLLRLPRFSDMRGDITVAEFDSHIPFEVKRVFFMYAVPSGDVRGEHAHRICAQVLLALSGGVSIVVDDGSIREEVRLDDPSIGLLIPQKIWSGQYRFAPGTVLAVFCSENYDSQEYIRDYDAFLDIVGRPQRT